MKGEGVPKSNEKAVYWFERAAENDSALAMDALAEAYRTGEMGLKMNPVRFDYWQKRAAESRSRTHEIDPAKWTFVDWIKYRFLD